MSDEQAEAGEEPTPHPFYNWMSVIGATLVVFFGTAVVFFLALGLWSEGATGYGGLTLLPLLFVVALGLVMVAFGWTRERGRIARGERSSFFDKITVDPWKLASGAGPLMLAGVVAATSFVLLGAGAGSVAVVEYSESNTFCMDACHSVMGPEAATYLQSPHARVACSECHVAPGTEGFLRAKIGGVRQLFHTLTGRASRPIHTPLHNSVLSRDVCQRCHPAGGMQSYDTLTRRYFLSGEEVMPVSLAMVLKVGAGGAGLMKGAGIHYHMQIAKKVEYKARDAQRQQIAWIRVTDQAGEVKEFDLESAPLSEEERGAIPARTMDCLDCHNRIAHPFHSPTDSVNAALDSGELPVGLPHVKVASVHALDGDYDTTAAARDGLGEAMRSYYEDEAPEVLEEHADLVDQSVVALRAIYERSIFPEMKVDWRTHPDNRSHRDYAGCFRCHNDEMKTAEGEAVFSNCSACHAILAADNGGIRSMEDFDRGADFVHPEDFDTLVEYSACSECHTGGKELYE